jgi:hypothetical protein
MRRAAITARQLRAIMIGTVVPGPVKEKTSAAVVELLHEGYDTISVGPLRRQCHEPWRGASAFESAAWLRKCSLGWAAASLH